MTTTASTTLSTPTRVVTQTPTASIRIGSTQTQRSSSTAGSTASTVSIKPTTNTTTTAASTITTAAPIRTTVAPAATPSISTTQSIPNFGAANTPVTNTAPRSYNDVVFSQDVPNLPAVKQTSSMACGVAALTSIFQSLGVRSSYNQLDQFFRHGVDMGLSLQWMRDGVNRSGTGLQSQVYNNMTLQDLVSLTKKGSRVILAVDKYDDQTEDPYKDPSDKAGHYLVLDGIEMNAGGQINIRVMDPAYGQFRTMSWQALQRLWSNIDFSGRQTGINNAAVVISANTLVNPASRAFTGAAKQFDDASYRYNQMQYGN